MGVLHTPSRHTFECDGSQRVFPIPSLMISQDFVRIEIDGVLQSDRKQWDIVNNSLVFVEAPINGAILDVQVASDSESLGELGMIANVDILAQNIINVNKVANINLDVTKVANINLDVTKVAGIVSEIPIVSAISTDVTTVASINSDVITVANIYTDVTKVANIDTKVTTVANNILDIQNADENALIAKEEAWKAEADRLTAKSYATEPENVFVKIYTSNNDGTFTVTDTTDYSSYHWEIKASTLVTTGIIDDVTSASNRTYSSNKIDGIVNTINNSINTIEGNINTIEGNITTIDNTTVKLIGNQTIEDVKTFTSSPIVPTPTTNFQVATKQYVDGYISNIQTLPIGAILNGYTIFDNCIVAFGGEFNRANYPKLWAYLQANPSLVKTQAQWTTEATANDGICGFFSSGNGTTTFRVPNLDKAFLRPDNRGVGSYQGDAIRNIMGTFNTRKNASSLTPTGVFSGVSSGDGSNNTASGEKVTFNASTVVPTSTENRPKNIAVLPLIVAK